MTWLRRNALLLDQARLLDQAQRWSGDGALEFAVRSHSGEIGQGFVKLPARVRLS